MPKPRDHTANSFSYRASKYQPYTDLPTAQMAVQRLSHAQIAVFAALGIGLLAGLALSWHTTLRIIVAAVTALYFTDLVFALLLISRSFGRQVELQVPPRKLRRSRWPSYTVLCPLYREWEVLPQFCRAMRRLNYPTGQLEVMLLMEADDLVTIEQVAQMRLPENFRVVIVPDGQPKTKPKACNYGLSLAAGDYVVIYDAEDIPDRDQLKKAVIAFESNPSVFCVQAKLNYYNINQNILTRLFTLEYSLWFDLVLTGLQGLNAPIPLGGTSNHFRTAGLRRLHGWDPFNVTEDADLGMRIAKQGFRTAILDSTTMEEANSRLGNWLRQRSRWIKGYAQTYLVHMRALRNWRRSRSRLDLLAFQVIVGGKVVSLLINPLLWALTLSYFLFRPEVGGFVQSLYLTPVYYVGLFSLVIGNFLYMYYYMMGAARRDQWELIPYALLVPVYWLAMSVAAFFALYELIARPFYWHKTRHGLHLSSPAPEPEPQAETITS